VEIRSNSTCLTQPSADEVLIKFSGPTRLAPRTIITYTLVTEAVLLALTLLVGIPLLVWYFVDPSIVRAVPYPANLLLYLLGIGWLTLLILVPLAGGCTLAMRTAAPSKTLRARASGLEIVEDGRPPVCIDTAQILAVDLHERRHYSGARGAGTSLLYTLEVTAVGGKTSMRLGHGSLNGSRDAPPPQLESTALTMAERVAAQLRKPLGRTTQAGRNWDAGQVARVS